jgi:hypothetical protein
MTTLKMLSAAAVLATMVAGPAMAQTVNQRHTAAYSETYDPGSNNRYNYREAHNDLSGPLCVPGARTVGEDGQTYRCQ